MSPKTFITRPLNQDAIYWSSPLPDGFGGYSFALGVEIKVWWDDIQELFTSSIGEQKLSRSAVYLRQDIEIGAYLFLGQESDLVISLVSAGIDVLPPTSGMVADMSLGIDIGIGSADVMPPDKAGILLSPENYLNAYRIMGYEKTRDISGSNHLRKAWVI